MKKIVRTVILPAGTIIEPPNAVIKIPEDRIEDFVRQFSEEKQKKYEPQHGDFGFDEENEAPCCTIQLYGKDNLIKCCDEYGWYYGPNTGVFRVAKKLFNAFGLLRDIKDTGDEFEIETPVRRLELKRDYICLKEINVARTKHTITMGMTPNQMRKLAAACLKFAAEAE